MFAAPPEQSLEWNEAGVEGMARFLRRLWAAVYRHVQAGPTVALNVAALNAEQKAVRCKLHETIEKVSDDIGRRHAFNTAIAAVMELLNTLTRFEDDSVQGRAVLQEAWTAVTLLLNPIVPHTAHALWQALGQAESLIESQSFPTADVAAMVKDAVTLALQVNGKLRGTLQVSVSEARETIEAKALADTGVRRALDGLTVRKLIVVPGKIVNIVAS